MDSFNYYIDFYTSQINQFVTFNSNEQDKTQSKENQTKNIKKTLENAFSNLKVAPVYYFNATKTENFSKLVLSCIELISDNEKTKLEALTRKINQTIHNRTASLTKMTNEESKILDDLLGKPTKDLQEHECQILYNTTNQIGRIYKRYSLSCEMIAIIEKIAELIEENPALHFSEEDIQGNKAYVLRIKDFDMIGDTHEKAFLSFLEFYQNTYDPIAYHQDTTFIQIIIQKKINSSNLAFQKYLKSYLNTFILSYLLTTFDNLQDKFETDKPKLIDSANNYGSFFGISSPITEQGLKICITDGKEKKLGEKSKELFTKIESRKYGLINWYKALYQKVKDYQTIHPEAELPSIDPEAFEKNLQFVGPKNVHIPLLKQIQQWEKETQELAKKSSATEQTSQKKQTKGSQPTNKRVQHKKPGGPKPSHLSSQQTQEKNSSVLETIISSSTNTISQEQPSSQEKSTPVLFTPPQTQPEKPFVQLQESCPFAVHERILKWFNSKSELPLLNEESLLIHNFAWAANDVLWKFGMRYPHEESGKKEPAIAMLCQIEHSLFPKPQLFRFTATFSHQLEDNPSPSLTYDSSWICYHRNLTRREQENELVEGYIAHGKYQFIDFPALPSQWLHIQYPSEWRGKTYPDGSFIESVEGLVITIRDPKHDKDTQRCRLHLFVVK